MTVPVIVAPRAAAWITLRATDLEAEFGSAASDRFLDLMQEAFDFLADSPLAAPVGLVPGTRTVSRGSYLISYRPVMDRHRTVARVIVRAVRVARQGDARAPRR